MRPPPSLVLVALLVAGCGSSTSSTDLFSGGGSAADAGDEPSEDASVPADDADDASAEPDVGGSADDAAIATDAVDDGSGDLDAADDGATPVDSGQDAAPPPHPGLVSCPGTADCAVPGTVCCLNGAFPFSSPTCFPLVTGCLGGGDALACDEQTDCAAGQTCCAFLAGSRWSVGCFAACAGSGVRICRSDAECGAGACRPLDHLATVFGCD